MNKYIFLEGGEILAEKKDNSFVVLAIVAIVAIVAIAVLFMNKGTTKTADLSSIQPSIKIIKKQQQLDTVPAELVEVLEDGPQEEENTAGLAVWSGCARTCRRMGARGWHYVENFIYVAGSGASPDSGASIYVESETIVNNGVQ